MSTPTTGDQRLKDDFLAGVGGPGGEVQLKIGPKFLELFSAQLYSSPNKAFEELVSNAWDAGAKVAYVGVPDGLTEKRSAIWVLDNGESMDLNGLRDLWNVAVSHKPLRGSKWGRAQIGRFGIGKLATYLLANQLTYVCKAPDGVIRAVMVDYREIDASSGTVGSEEPLSLVVKELTVDDLGQVLLPFQGGDRIKALIDAGVPHVKTQESDDEFGDHYLGESGLASSDTWTLVIMTSLKPAGLGIQIGRLRQILRSALPLGDSMTVVLNDEVLEPSKVDVEIVRDMVLGKDTLDLETIEIDGVAHTVSEHSQPMPHITIDGIDGNITGHVRLYKDRISGRRSDEHGPSNGFLVNILGRIINIGDREFGLPNLSHGVWARVRVTVRADGLNAHLRVSRDGLLDDSTVKTFRAFLLGIFNHLRVVEGDGPDAAFPSPGDILTKNWGVVPLLPLKQMIMDSGGEPSALPTFVDAANTKPSEVKAHWQVLTEESDPTALIALIDFETRSEDAPLFRFRLEDRALLVNRLHPFCREYEGTREERNVLLAAAFVDLLTETYLAASGLGLEVLNELHRWRDKAYRLTAQISRVSAPQVAALLTASSKESVKGFERAVGEALGYLGFTIDPKGEPGEPEGIATAPLPAKPDGSRATYSFTYDAKSSVHGKAKTSNLNVAGLARHRRRYQADHALVVAPGFEQGAVDDECTHDHVTPITADDLASLLMAVGTYGPQPLDEFRSLFDCWTVASSHSWVQAFTKRAAARAGPLSMGTFLKALDNLGYQRKNPLTCDRVASELVLMGYEEPNRGDVQALARALHILMPSLVDISGFDIVLNAPAAKIRQELRSQLGTLDEAYRFGLDQKL